eukprot:TRINITY_DN74_c0_g1_i1.p1 TRINITY_DN74_c0_g1~~TRINITY_DN74_c0_g1_i1.p1  ORF type:complete len:511 (+),score=68.79 TRINITY_DN74_c0_g1_i1:332-1864(+)
MDSSYPPGASFNARLPPTHSPSQTSTQAQLGGNGSPSQYPSQGDPNQLSEFFAMTASIPLGHWRTPDPAPRLLEPSLQQETEFRPTSSSANAFPGAESGGNSIEDGGDATIPWDMQSPPGELSHERPTHSGSGQRTGDNDGPKSKLWKRKASEIESDTRSYMHWPTEAIEALIQLVQEYQRDITDKKLVDGKGWLARKHWIALAEELKERVPGADFTHKQVSDKFGVLKRKYELSVIEAEKAGKPCTWPYFELLHSYTLDWQRNPLVMASMTAGQGNGAATLGDQATGLSAGPSSASPSGPSAAQLLGLPAKGRIGRILRKTKETNVEVSINLDGTGICSSASGIPFLDHMMDQLASHGLFDVTVRAVGDLHIDDHHTNEDIGLALGSALAQALGDRKGIRRFGDFTAPLDEALIHCVLDLSGRPFCSCGLEIPTQRVGTYDTQLVEHFFQSFANTSGMTLHLRQLAGQNSHHIIEASFKAFARALRQATETDSRRAGTVPSSKGVLSQK